MEYKDLLGGKGANLAEMTSVLKLPVPPGFTISTDACRAYMDGGWPDGLDDEIAAHVATLEKAMGRKLGDAADPLLVSVRSGAKFSMPGMMDTVLNLGLNDRSVKGLADVDRQRALRLRQLPPVHRHVRPDRARHRRRALRRAAGGSQGGKPRCKTDAELTADGAEAAVRAVQAGRQGRHRQAVPAGPGRSSCAAPSRRCSRAGTAHAAIAYRVRERISHDLGTAVNVQTMVFGNRDDNCGTGVGFTRNAATGENKPYGDFLVNAQGEDVVAGIRNTEDLDSDEGPLPEVPRRADGRSSTGSSAHYSDMCDTEFTIEQGKLWMLQTARRQAHRRCRAAHGRRHDRRSGKGKRAGRSASTRRSCASPPTTSTRCCTRSSPARARCSPRASPRRRAPRSARSTSPPTTPPTPPSGARRSSSCATRPARKTCTA